MKTAIKIALASILLFVFAMIGITFGQEVEVLHGIVYCGTNFFLHDDNETPLHTRISAIAADNSWTNGITVEGTNDIDEVAVLKIHHEGWQGQLAIYDPTNGFYKLYPNDGVVRGSYTTNPPLSLWDGETGAWVGQVTGSTLVSAETLATGKDGTDYSRILFYDNVEKFSYALSYCDTGVTFGPTNAASKAAWQYISGTNVWQGRIADTESARIAALPVSPAVFNSTSWLQSDGTNLYFISTVSPGFTNALTTNAP